jgi:hypothetical protein
MVLSRLTVRSNEESSGMNTLKSLDNWRVSIRETSPGVYIVDAIHQSGPQVSFSAKSVDDAVSQLHAYAGEVETAVRIRKSLR